jgi:hypothetical protein
MATQPSSETIDQLIICSPYEKPGEHWKYNRETRRFSREPGPPLRRIHSRLGRLQVL